MAVSDEENEAAKEIAKLEQTLSRGKTKYVIIYVIWYESFCVFAIAVVLFTLGKPPPQAVIPLSLLFPLSAAVAIVVAVLKWKRIPSRINELRAGQFVRPPPELRDAEILSGIALILLIVCVAMAVLPDELAHPFVSSMASAGSILSLCAVYKSYRHLLPSALTTRYRAKALFYLFGAVAANVGAFFVVFWWDFLSGFLRQ